MYLRVFEVLPVLPVLAEPKVVASCIVNAGAKKAYFCHTYQPISKQKFRCPIQVGKPCNQIATASTPHQANHKVATITECLTMKFLARWAG